MVRRRLVPPRRAISGTRQPLGWRFTGGREPDSRGGGVQGHQPGTASTQGWPFGSHSRSRQKDWGGFARLPIAGCLELEQLRIAPPRGQ